MNLRKLRDLLTPFGELAEGAGTLLTDRNKTQCCAKFVDGAAAAKAAQELDGIRWLVKLQS